jgi:hypothetical protein
VDISTIEDVWMSRSCHRLWRYGTDFDTSIYGTHQRRFGFLDAAIQGPGYVQALGYNRAKVDGPLYETYGSGDGMDISTLRLELLSA